MEVELRHVAHARSGDKGDTSNVAVIAYSAELYEPLKAQLTPERMKELYGPVVRGEVQRFPVDHLWVLNFVLHGALGGGVSRSARLDQYGKTLSAVTLGAPLEIPDGLVNQLVGWPAE
jgi:hypothetical protein